MSSRNRGQGVRKFWEARASGEDVDVKIILEEHPDEALELADAIREAATQEDSAAQERMWLARAQVLNRLGEEVTLGALLRTSREEAELSTSALSRRAQGRGAKAADRNRFLTSGLPSDGGEDATSYIDWVRADLGLPPSPADAIQ